MRAGVGSGSPPPSRDCLFRGSIGLERPIGSAPRSPSAFVALIPQFSPNGLQGEQVCASFGDPAALSFLPVAAWVAVARRH